MYMLVTYPIFTSIRQFIKNEINVSLLLSYCLIKNKLECVVYRFIKFDFSPPIYKILVILFNLYMFLIFYIVII